MTIQDYLIDHVHYDWTNLLVGWTWLLPQKFTVWLVNRFGDLFLMLPDDSIHFLDVGAGALTKLADSQDEFCRKIDDGQNASTWLMMPLVDRLVAAGVRLQPGFCYSYRTLPVAGGKPTPDNTLFQGLSSTTGGAVRPTRASGRASRSSSKRAFGDHGKVVGHRTNGKPPPRCQ